MIFEEVPESDSFLKPRLICKRSVTIKNLFLSIVWFAIKFHSPWTQIYKIQNQKFVWYLCLFFVCRKHEQCVSWWFKTKYPFLGWATIRDPSLKQTPTVPSQNWYLFKHNWQNQQTPILILKFKLSRFCKKVWKCCTLNQIFEKDQPIWISNIDKNFRVVLNWCCCQSLESCLFDFRVVVVDCDWIALHWMVVDFLNQQRRESLYVLQISEFQSEWIKQSKEYKEWDLAFVVLRTAIMTQKFHDLITHQTKLL